MTAVPSSEDHLARTMFDKIWDTHVVRDVPGEVPVLYIDRHLTHEATSPQAFAGLRGRGLPVRRKSSAVAIVDHNVPTMPGRRNRPAKRAVY